MADYSSYCVDPSYFFKNDKPVISGFLYVGFKRKQLSEAYGIEYQLLDDDNITPEASKALSPLTQVMAHLVEVFKGDIGKIVDWLSEGNATFHGLTPMDMCYIRRETEVKNLLISCADEDREIFRG